ncbi:hypothetical protein DL93DRAFT_2074804 [Clavulina sp. PMI_390]|nr:hypothetical protein DL93DRAFT_2074804 [Clavulina sp. PMI_390]
MLMIKLVSTARTGYFYTTQKNRLYPTFSVKKYDPISMCDFSLPSCALLIILVPVS